MIFLAVTSDTWIVTGLGFGIVLALLFCLVFIMMLFGWIMQMGNGERKKDDKGEKPKANSPKPIADAAPSEPEKAAIAMALSAAKGDDEAAVAYALYLAHHSKHDIPTGMIATQVRETAWNTKSYGLNNIGF